MSLLGVHTDVLRLIFSRQYLDVCSLTSARHTCRRLRALVPHIRYVSGQNFLRVAAHYEHAALADWARRLGAFEPLYYWTQKWQCDLLFAECGDMRRLSTALIDLNAAQQCARTRRDRYDVRYRYEQVLLASVRSGYLPAVQYVHAQRARFLPTHIRPDVCTEAARCADDTLLRWACTEGYRPNKATCAAAAARGCLDMLRWLRERGAPWDSETCAEAARAGHLAVLQYAHESHAPWSERVCEQAARYDHLAVFEYALANNAPLAARATARIAALYGHLEILRALHRALLHRASPLRLDVDLCIIAALRCDVDMLEQLRTWNAPSNEYVRVYAALHGHLPVLESEHRAYGVCNTPLVCTAAVCGGHIAVFEWLCAHGYTLDVHQCSRIMSDDEDDYALRVFGSQYGSLYMECLAIDSIARQTQGIVERRAALAKRLALLYEFVHMNTNVQRISI